MELLLVHPENAEQLEAVKAALKALNVKFEDPSELPAPVLSKVEEGLAQYANGEHISLEEFKKKHFITK